MFVVCKEFHGFEYYIHVYKQHEVELAYNVLMGTSMTNIETLPGDCTFSTLDKLLIFAVFVTVGT